MTSPVLRHSSSAATILADLNIETHREFLLEVLADYYASPIGGGGIMPNDVRERVVPGLLQCQNRRVFFAVPNDPIDSKAYGMAVCFVNYSTFKAKPLINIHDLAVKSEHQGKGIGKLLLETVIEYARSNDYCAVTLEVRRDNDRARALYTKYGFADVHEPLSDTTMLFGKLTLNG